MTHEDQVEQTIATVGPRLRAMRERRQSTLTQLSRASGISVSTLSRLESGGRKPTLELLLRLARAHEVPLDQLINDATTTDPRVRSEPMRRHGRTMIPLTRRPGGLQAYKMIIEPSEEIGDLQTHEGYEWMYVLNGRLHLLLGE